MEGNDHAIAAVRYAAELIANADAVLITAGAGMSVDSGLPLYKATMPHDGYARLFRLAQAKPAG